MILSYNTSVRTKKSAMSQPSSHHIVLLHGWTPDPTVLQRWLPLKEKLEAAGYQVHLWKIPGLTTQQELSFSPDQYMAWLLEKIQPFGSCVLVGHSFGGQLASRFTADHPEYVSQLVLIDSSGIIDMAPLKVMKRVFFKAVAKLGKLFTNSPKLRKMLYTFIRERDYLLANTAQRETIHRALNTSVRPFLQRIKTPTLILWGKNDQITPLKLGKIMHQDVVGSSLVVLPARHSPPYTHPQLVFEEIHAFIQGEKT